MSERTIELEEDNQLRDTEIDTSIGSITNCGGECESYLWMSPDAPWTPRLYTAQNLRDIADILDKANK